jgi:hypothetical protein
MFMLGSFTSGLFGGARDMFSLAQSYNEVRDKLRMNKGADLIQNAIQNSGGGTNDATTNGLYGTSTAPTTDTSRPTYASFDDDPELSKLPPLKKPMALALGSTSSPSEGRGVYGRGQQTTPSSPREGRAFGGAPSDGALGRLSDQPGPGETENAPAGHQSGSGLYNFLDRAGQALRNFSTNHTNGAPAQQPQQQPPAYLPPQTPPVPVGPQQPAPGASPGALMGPMSGAGYPSGPGLAMQQNPLAGRIIAATNPAAGSVV